jgi:hypothetical protein
MAGLEDIKATQDSIFIGGKDRRVKFGFKAWAEIEDTIGSIAELGEQMKNKPTKILPDLIRSCLVPVEGEIVTRETIIEWLDELGGFGDIKDIMEQLMNAIMKSVPTPKAGKGKN